jgi:hypothetical protein
MGLEETQLEQQQEGTEGIKTSVAPTTSTSNPTILTNQQTTTTTNKPTRKFTLRKIKYSKQIMQELNKLEKSNISDLYRSQRVIRLTGTRCCFVCQAIPNYELLYDEGGATRIERYCKDCYKKRKQNEQELQELKRSFIVVDSVARFSNPIQLPHPT